MLFIILKKLNLQIPIIILDSDAHLFLLPNFSFLFISIEISEPSNIADFRLSNWPSQTITKNKEIVCSDFKFLVKKYYDLELSDINSESFSFEI